MDTQLRETLKNKKRVIVKIGSSSLLHEETGKSFKTGTFGKRIV